MQADEDTPQDLFELIRRHQRAIFMIHNENIDVLTFKPLSPQEVDELAASIRLAIEQVREWMYIDPKVQLLYQLQQLNIDKLQADGGWDFVFNNMTGLTDLNTDEKELLKHQLYCIWPQHSQQDLDLTVMQKNMTNNFLYGQHRSLINQWDQQLKSLRVYLLSTQVGFANQFLTKLKVVYLPYEFMSYCELQEGDQLFTLRPRSKRLLRIAIQLLKRDFSNVNFLLDDNQMYKLQNARQEFCRSKVEDRANRQRISQMMNYLLSIQAKMLIKNRRDGLPNLKSLVKVDQEMHFNVWMVQVEITNDEAEMGNSDCEESFPEYHNNGPTFLPQYDTIDHQLFQSETESSQPSQRSDSINRQDYY